MIADSSVGLGVPVYKRTEKLRNLLLSAEYVPIDTVYVADNGHTEEREAVYDEAYEFDLVVLDIEYDSGLGNCRRSIVDSLEEDYLLISDSDHTIPGNVDTLVQQLEERPAFGGICGLLFEHGGLRGTCHDLYEQGDILVRDIRGKEADLVGGQPLFEFDFLQNVAAFRRECVADYAWDPNLQQGKPHLDFYVGHKHQTDWRFGCCPAVQFPHYPGGSSSYTANRNKRERLMDAREYFLDKWDYRQIVYGQLEWLETQDQLPSDRRVAELLVKRVLTRLPIELQAKVTDARQFVRRVRSRPPL